MILQLTDLIHTSERAGIDPVPSSYGATSGIPSELDITICILTADF